MRLIDADKLLGVIAEQERWNVPDFVYKSIKEAPTIDIDSIIAEHENIGYEKGFRDGYAEAVDFVYKVLRMTQRGFKEQNDETN